MDSNKRPENMVRITTRELAEKFIAEQIAAVKKQVGDKKVLLALSGGVDSSVVAALLIKAIGKQLVCVFVDHGCMRLNEAREVKNVFKGKFGINLIQIVYVPVFHVHQLPSGRLEKPLPSVGGKFFYRSRSNKITVFP